MPGSRELRKADGPSSSDLYDYYRLRSLVLGDDYEKVLRERTDRSEIQRISSVITEAVAERNKKDGSLTNQLTPIIETSIDRSIQDNRSQFADVIYPIIGPAVRKAVAASLSHMVESLNQLLKESLSLKSVVWRIKAWKAGIPYSEYIILKNLHYRVEQAFLIHRDTGLLIESCSAKNVSHQDPDLVSAMLIAISDFITDSFNNNEDSASLEAIHFGDLTLLVESGPEAVIAVAVRGVVNAEITDRLKNTNENIHQLYSKQLKTFNGQSDNHADYQSILQDTLVEKVKDKQRSFPWLSAIVLFIIAIYIIYSAFSYFRLSALETKIINSIAQQPGYQLIDYSRTGKTLDISLIRSPTAISIDALKQSIQISPLQLKIQDNVAALADPSLFLPVLDKKYPLDFSFRVLNEGYQLIGSGIISSDLAEELLSDPIYVNLFNSFDDTNVEYTELSAKNIKYRHEFEQLYNQINSHDIYFESATTTMTSDSTQSLQLIIQQLKSLLELQKLSGENILQIAITGFADSQGTSNFNNTLSRDRAKLVASILSDNGIDKNLITTWGLGSGDIDSIPLEKQRRVSVSLLRD